MGAAQRGAERAPPPFLAESAERPDAAAAPEAETLRTAAKPGGFLRCLHPGFAPGADILGVVSHPRWVPSSESPVSAERSLFAPRGLRAEVSRCLRLRFAPCGGSLRRVPSCRPLTASSPQFRTPGGGRQGPGPHSRPPALGRCAAGVGVRSEPRRSRRVDAHSCSCKGLAHFALGARGPGGLGCFLDAGKSP